MGLGHSGKASQREMEFALGLKTKSTPREPEWKDTSQQKEQKEVGCLQCTWGGASSGLVGGEDFEM